MSGRDDEHDRLLEAAMGAALKVLDDATDDDDMAEALWRRLCSDVCIRRDDERTAETRRRAVSRRADAALIAIAPARCGPVAGRL